MTRTEQRFADLKRQVAELATEVSDLRSEAFVIRIMEELLVDIAGVNSPIPAALRRRPRHLRLAGGVS